MPLHRVLAWVETNALVKDIVSLTYENLGVPKRHYFPLRTTMLQQLLGCSLMYSEPKLLIITNYSTSVTLNSLNAELEIVSNPFTVEGNE